MFGFPYLGPMKMTDLHLRQKVIIYLMNINQSKENNQNNAKCQRLWLNDQTQRSESKVLFSDGTI